MKQVYTPVRSELYRSYWIEECLPIVPGDAIMCRVWADGIHLGTLSHRLCCEFYGQRLEDVKIAVFTMVEAGIVL